MSKRIKIGIEVQGAEKAKDEIEDVGKAASKSSGAAEQGLAAIDKMTGGLVSSFKGLKSGLKSAVVGMKSFRTAMISSGVGALVVAVGSLVAYFTKTRRGAEMLEKATASLGAVFNVLTDMAVGLGEQIVGVFQDPIPKLKEFWENLKTFVVDKIEQLIEGVGLLGKAIGLVFQGEFSAAAETAAEGFGKVVDSALALNPVTAVAYQVATAVYEQRDAMAEAAQEAWALSEASIALREKQRELRVDQAKARAEIKADLMLAQDQTASVEDRIAAIERAGEAERKLMKRRMDNAKEELRIHKAEMAMSESTEEDYERLADLEAAVAEAQLQSIELLTTIQGQKNAVYAQDKAQREAAAKEVTDAQAKIDAAVAESALKDKDAKAQELEAITSHYAELVKLAEQHGLDTTALMEAKGKAEARVNKKYNDQVVANEKAKAAAIWAAQKGAISGATQLLGSMMKSSREQKAFAVGQVLLNKGIAISEAIKNAQQSAGATGPAAVFSAPGFTATLVGLVLGGFAEIKSILDQAGASMSDVGGSVPTAQGGGGASGPQIPQIRDFQQTNQLNIPPVAAYVLQGELNDAQALHNAIDHRSSL